MTRRADLRTRFASLAALTLLAALASSSDQAKKAQVVKPPLPDPAAINAKAAILIDEFSGKVLWAKNADAQRFPASTTKIMTALLLIERCRMDDVVTAPADIEKVGEASLHLKPGETLTVHNLLWGILLRSANDGCVAAAVHVAGSVEAFAKLMNERAKQIGCTGTDFHNPNGLNDPAHVTTAHDLALIAREAMRYPEFREIVRNRRHTIERSINTADRYLISRNKFLEADKTADGIKTGFTRPAGQCFVGSASRNGARFISVVLGSEAWLDDTNALINWGFKSHEIRRTVLAGQPIPELAPVRGGRPISVGPVRAIRYVVTKGSAVSITTQATFAPNLQAPVARGQQVGTLAVADGTGWTDTIPLVALEDVPLEAARGSRGPYYVFGLGLVGLWAVTRRRRRRMIDYLRV